MLRHTFLSPESVRGSEPGARTVTAMAQSHRCASSVEMVFYHPSAMWIFRGRRRPIIAYEHFWALKRTEQRRKTGQHRASEVGANSLACFGALLAVILAGVSVGFVTWANDSCTLYVTGYKANVTLQGWGSNDDCQQLLAQNPGVVSSIFSKVVRDATFGLLDPSKSFSGGSAAGSEVCEGWNGTIRYTVRDQSSTFSLDPNRIGKSLCSDISAST
jgi:hypothetical protein